MRFLSTRNGGPGVGIGEAIEQGLAPDGGLYVPQRFPRLTGEALADAPSLAVLAERVLGEFFADDPLADALRAITERAFSFPAPLTEFSGGGGAAHVLELFHGPTGAFKDFGARFLAECLERRRAGNPRRLLVLVATSGDTGGAVAAAFHERPWAEVVVLYPKGRVSARQEHQITCWGGNVRAFAVRGSFDDCQRLAREAFLSAEVRRTRDLSSANSINVGRLLPQVVTFAAASRQILSLSGRPASFIVPSGNLGHAAACVWAREMGLPIDEIVLAHNGNQTVPDFLSSGEWQPRPSVPTLASAMDVGNPSNMERLRWLYPGWQTLRGEVEAWSVTDDEIRARIRADYKSGGRIWCPHTAVAAEVYAQFTPERKGRAWVIVATAHPAKFETIVEPLIGSPVDVPPSLAALLERPSRSTELEPTLDALLPALDS